MAMATDLPLPRGQNLADITHMRARSGPSAAALARRGAFGAASRHSRLVRFLKVAVPSIALVGLVLFVLVTLFNPFGPKTIDVDVGKVDVSGDRLTMQLPRLTGFNRRQEAYNVTAKTASQRLTAPGLIDLTDLEAVISMPGKDKAVLKAATGKFDSTAEILMLHDDVRVTSTRGYSADLAVATVDFKAGTVKSEEPVKVHLESGIVEAGALDVKGGGDVITFTKGVTTRFHTTAKGNGERPPHGTPAPGSSDSRGSTQ
jgi:lipopolysaccharide export system protein LptC